ncbi:MAG TPA: hypothetical protein PLD47_10140 [Aggregatilineales bacterium]|nr:hypothetical protein [Anaerolineales bacterium]HRE48073.1 hypothetical protein [Aggregatilineales bacterium]
MINRIWIEREYRTEGASDPYNGITAVVVGLEESGLWSASFATLDYIRQQMTLNRELVAESPLMAPVRFMTLETPHVIVDDLHPDTIEDTIDNLITMGTFEGIFVRCEDVYFLHAVKG